MLRLRSFPPYNEMMQTDGLILVDPLVILRRMSTDIWRYHHTI